MGIFKSFNNLKIGPRLNLIFILTLGVLLVAMIIVLQTSMENFAVQTGQQRVEQEVEVIRRRYAEAEQELLVNAGALATATNLAEAVAEGDAEQVRTIILVNAARLNLTEVDVVDAVGERLVAVTEEAETLNADQETALLAFALIGSNITGLIVEEGGPESRVRLAAATPVRDTTSGEIVGALLASWTIDDEFLDGSNFGREDIQLALIYEGRIVADALAAHGHEGHVASRNMLIDLLDEAAIRQTLNGQTVIIQDIVFAEDGAAHAHAYMPLTVGGKPQATIGIMAELNELFPLRNRLVFNTSIVFVILAIVASIVFALVSAGYISAPINKLRSVTEQMERGNYGLRAEVRSKDEIGQLAGAYNSLADQLQQLIGSLEQRVADRTQRLEVVASLSERLAAILKVDELLVQLVNQIKAEFGYYHAHIYLLDAKRQKLVVTAGTGQAGAAMKTTGHHIPLDAPTSLVARAARSGQVVRVDNVRETEDWLPNPLLPNTYSEMAVPIVLEGDVVGVLDVQQDKVAGLDEGDADLLRSLASQVAVAIRNARLFEQVETALAETRAAHERYLEHSWQKTRTIVRQGQHIYADPEAVPLDPAIQQVLTEARQQALGEAVPTVVTPNGDPGQKSLVAPVHLRDTTIGAVQLYSSRPDQSWSEDDLAVVEAVIDQLADTAESLRLFEETRERASFESLVGEITEKLRQAPNLERLAAIATEELSRRLSATHAKLNLGIRVQNEGADGESLNRETLRGKQNGS